jgi:Xaa-Pro aminopeptidase
MEKQTRKAAFVNHQALQEGMDRADLDVLVATSPENTFYLSGCYLQTQLVLRDRLALVVMPREGAEAYIVCNIEESLARSVGWIDDVRTYVENADSPVDALAEVLEEKGLDKGRVGIEVKFCTAAYYWELEGRLPGATLVPADAVLGQARALKTPAEIERLHKAAVVTEEAVYTAWKRSHPGDTEKDVAERMVEEMMKRGADRVDHISLGCGQNTAVVHHQPGPKKLEPGDLFTSDFGVVYQGFWSDIARVGVVGQPSQLQRDLYKTLREVQRATIARMKPGVEARELFNFAKEEYLRRGVDFAWRPHIGHSMPQTRGHEDPRIQPFDETPLEPNMLIAIEPSFRAGKERYHIEDLVLVTDNEPRILSDWWNTEELFIFE